MAEEELSMRTPTSSNGEAMDDGSEEETIERNDDEEEEERGVCNKENDYMELKDVQLSLPIRNPNSEEQDVKEDVLFVLCLWIYLSGSGQFPSSIINQGFEDGGESIPFLTLNAERKLTLMPVVSVHEESRVDDSERFCVSAEQECCLEKWVHVGCEVTPNVIRLHINGALAGEVNLSCLPKRDSEQNVECIKFSGNHGKDDEFQVYVYDAQLLGVLSVTGHYLKDPPLELSIDNSSCISEDIGGDGVWNVVGGKASCRRKFDLDVVLLDALGRSVHQEMELVASLLYADTGLPVEKRKDDADAPLLITLDCFECNSTDQPIKLVNGQASFKMKISQLSSKCDNRLFRVFFYSPSGPKYPFLQVHSRPIRCVSRNRSQKPPSMWRKPNTSSQLLDLPESPGMEEDNIEIQPNGDEHLHLSNLQGSMLNRPLKRVKAGHWKILGRTTGLNEENTSQNTSSINETDIAVMNFQPQLYNQGVRYGQGVGHYLSDREASQLKNPLLSKNFGQLSDLAVFKYCLQTMNERAVFLKEIMSSISEHTLADFAAQVSLYTGCSLNRYQILIAKRLVQEGTHTWGMITRNSDHVVWGTAIREIEKQFMRISLSVNRTLSSQDKEFLRAIAGCSETFSREAFDRLWRWVFPVALAISRPQLHAAWDCTSPKWVEGMITREEAESSLRNSLEAARPGSFLLRFPDSRSWPHPDAGSLLVSYLGADYVVHHTLLSITDSEATGKPLVDLLLAQPELLQLGRVRKARPVLEA